MAGFLLNVVGGTQYDATAKSSPLNAAIDSGSALFYMYSYCCQ